MKVSHCHGYQSQASPRISSLQPCPKLPRIRACPRSKLILCRNNKRTYQVEVAIDENEDIEGAFKRFNHAVGNCSLIYEARKRMFFENYQDILKRKQQEKGKRKQRAFRDTFVLTMADKLENEADNHVFGDLFPALGSPQHDESATVRHGSTESGAATESADRGSDELDKNSPTSFKPQKKGLNAFSPMKHRLYHDVYNQLSQERWQARQVDSDANGSSEQSNLAASEKVRRSIPFQTSKERRKEHQQLPKSAPRYQAKTSSRQSQAADDGDLDWDILPDTPAVSQADTLNAPQPVIPADQHDSLDWNNNEGQSLSSADSSPATETSTSTPAALKNPLTAAQKAESVAQTRLYKLTHNPEVVPSLDDLKLLRTEERVLANRHAALSGQPRTSMNARQKSNLRSKINSCEKKRQMIRAVLKRADSQHQQSSNFRSAHHEPNVVTMDIATLQAEKPSPSTPSNDETPAPASLDGHPQHAESSSNTMKQPASEGATSDVAARDSLHVAQSLENEPLQTPKKQLQTLAALRKSDLRDQENLALALSRLSILVEAGQPVSTPDQLLLQAMRPILEENLASLQSAERDNMTKNQKIKLRNKVSRLQKQRGALEALLGGQTVSTEDFGEDAGSPSADLDRDWQENGANRKLDVSNAHIDGARKQFSSQFSPRQKERRPANV